MFFSPQRRAIFLHLNFKKWSAHEVFRTFWCENVLLATAACNFSTSQLQKVVRDHQFFNILTLKCASRHSGVQFFHIATSKVVRTCSEKHILIENVLLATAACNFFMSSLNSHLRTRRFTEVTFRPSPPTNHWKTQHFATSLTFRACGSSFYWLSRNCIFFLLTLLFFLLCHLLTLLLGSAFSTVHIVGS